MFRPNSVRPRVVWSATAVMLLSMVLIAVANVADSMWWEIVGVVTLSIAGVVALFGGITRDVHGELVGLRAELAAVGEGDPRRGIAAGEHLHDPRATHEVDTRPRPSMVPTGAELGSAATVGLVVVGAWLAISHNLLNVPFEPQTRGVAMREVGVALVVVLCAVLIGQHGRSRAASALCALAGALLVVAAFGVDSVTSVKINDAVVGVAIIVLAALTLMRTKKS